VALWASSVAAQFAEYKLENPQVGYQTSDLGRSTAIDGDTLLVGAPLTSLGDALQGGIVRVYRDDGLGNWALEAELIPSDAAAFNNPYYEFGTSVSISGGTAVVGAYGANGGPDAAYVFTRSGEIWTQQQKLTASDGAVDDRFGTSVAISGDTVIVGAYQDDDAGVDSGSAYVFVRSNGTWTQQQKLTASDGAEGDRFGISVALSGDTAVAGAYQDDDGGIDSGSAYVFTRSNGVWTEQQKLTASDASGAAYFGYSVALAGDTAVVGADGDESFPGLSTGSAYVFTRQDSVWTQQAKLTSSDAAAGDRFGYSVSLSGDTAVIGAYWDEVAGISTGSAYVFVRVDNMWSQEQKITASDGAGADLFGAAVAVSGDTAVVGAYGNHDSSRYYLGSAYVFARSGESWTEQAMLSAYDAAAFDQFGYSVALSGSTAVVGAPYDDISTYQTQTGSACVFVRSGGGWTQQGKLTASDAAFGDSFGRAVAISGDTAVVGAYEHVDGRGAAYVFVRSGGTWTQQAKLFAVDAAKNDYFGWSVAVSGDTAVVGAHGDNSYAGSAYVYTRSNGAWTEQQKLVSSDPAAKDFGYSVAVEGDTVVVGTPFNVTGLMNSGSAHVFTRLDGVWTEQQKLTASDAATNDSFANSLALSGDTLAVGAYGDDNRTGSTYVFTRSNGTWMEQQKLIATDAAPDTWFGYSVALDGEGLVAGAYGYDEWRGAAYVFTRSEGSWTEQEKLTASDAAVNDRLGLSVAIRGDSVLAGALWNDDPEVDSGSAYVFTVYSLLAGTGWMQH